MMTSDTAAENVNPGFAALRAMGGWVSSCVNISRGLFATKGCVPVSR